jgi:hypothetical protein
VLDTLKAGDAGERIRVAAETMYQALIDTELSATIGAGPWERSEARTNQRNGSRPRTLSTASARSSAQTQDVTCPVMCSRRLARRGVLNEPARRVRRVCEITSAANAELMDQRPALAELAREVLGIEDSGNGHGIDDE